MLFFADTGIKTKNSNKVAQLQLSRCIADTRLAALYTLRLNENKLSIDTKLSKAEKIEAIKLANIEQALRQVLLKENIYVSKKCDTARGS